MTSLKNNSLQAGEKSKVQTIVRRMVKAENGSIRVQNFDWKSWGSGSWNPGRGCAETLFASCYITLCQGDAEVQKLVSISSDRLSALGRPSIDRVSIR
jgi:hypothetical protein